MKFSTIFFLFLILSALVLTALCVRQALSILVADKISYRDLVPFERRNPQARIKILILGDSTAVGTGAATNAQSTAGYFGRDFPTAEIINISRNGKKLGGLLREFDLQPLGHFSLIVMQIGANDIIKFTPMKNIERDVVAVIERAKTIGDHVVILHSGNVGLAPIFCWPFDVMLTERSRKVREIYMRQAKVQGVVYVDLFSERNNDLFLTDVDRYYAPDHLHPSGDGYRWWYERIRQAMKQAGVETQDFVPLP